MKKQRRFGKSGGEDLTVDAVKNSIISKALGLQSFAVFHLLDTFEGENLFPLSFQCDNHVTRILVVE